MPTSSVTVNTKTIDVIHIPGAENPADLLTKPLEKVIHCKWLKHIRLDIEQSKVNQ